MLKNICSICYEPITDPLCTDCYLRHIFIWLDDLDMNLFTKELIIRAIKSKLDIDTLDDADCVICKNQNVAICYYCASILTQRVLRELNLPDETIEIFKEMFNHNTYNYDLVPEEDV